ncbi:MAG TPA: hypothetical protein VNL17_14455 [Verrucomicrobiae bacterium]|nr:hypothetical protein [Verrucomicrobiae bacterium]
MSAVTEPLRAPVQQPERRVFYSRNAGLCISANKGRKVMIDGELKRDGEKMIEFIPQPDDYGQFVTEDPELIEFLERRVATVGDVMLPEKYNELTTPLEMRVKELKDENARVIEDRNRLIKMLEELKNKAK